MPRERDLNTRGNLPLGAASVAAPGAAPRRLKVCPDPRGDYGYCRPVPVTPMPAPTVSTARVPTFSATAPAASALASSGLSLDEELSRLREDIAAERTERQALGRLVEALIKDRQGPQRRPDDGLVLPGSCSETYANPRNAQEWMPGFRALAMDSHAGPLGATGAGASLQSKVIQEE
ncbi:unnamed protein product, partial [Effrenium voratum]